MKTPEEILKDLPQYSIGTNEIFYHIENVLKSMQEYGKQQYNQGVKDAAENAKTKKIGNSGSWYDAGVDKDSILKLLKP